MKEALSNAINLRNLLLQSPMAIAVLKGPQHVFELANARYLHLAGNHDVVGKSIRQAFQELEGTGIYEVLDQVYSSGEPCVANEMLVKLNKGNEKSDEHYFNFVYQPSLETDGKTDGVIMYGVDVTEQVLARKKLEESEIQRTHAAEESAKAETSLRQSEEKYRTLFTSIDQGFTLCELIRNEEGKGVDFSMLEVNPTYEEQTGIRKEMVLGKALLKVFPSLEKWLETYAAVVDNQRPVVFERYFEETDRWFAIKAFPVEKERFAVLFSNITERKQAEEKIKESEHEIRAIKEQLDLSIRAGKIGIWHWDVKKDLLTWSKEQNEIYGVSDSEEITSSAQFNALIVPEDLKRIQLDQSAGNKSEHEYDFRIIRKNDGEIRWVQSRAKNIVDPQGALQSISGVNIDVTEQFIALNKIKESEERLRLATQTSSVGIWEWNVISNRIRWDQQMFHIYGIAPTSDGFVDYSTWRKAIAPEELAEQERILQDTVKNRGSSKRSFKIFRAKDGMLCDIEAIETARANALGETEWVVGTNMDITERKRSVEKITESEKQFNTLANNIQNLAWIANGEGWVYWYNKRWYEYTGTTLEEMKGWGWQKVHHPEHVKSVVDFVEEAWKVNKPFDLTFPLRGADGKYRWFLTRVFPVPDAEGKISSWIGTSTDIEEQKVFSEQLEKKVMERTVQLNDINKNLEQKNAELENLNNELEAFTYVSSHDLQEPLRKILILTGRIIDTEKENLSEIAKNYLNRMNDAAERMRALIQDLLSFSRLNSSEREFKITDLNEMVNDIKEEFKERIKEQNVTITTSEMGELNVIPFQFRQLLHNLISNSLKFSNADVPSHIIIKSIIANGSKLDNEGLLPETAYCHISVADNGIGFEKQFSEKIFQVFQKLHSKDEYAGTGIGLAIVKKIVDNHHGIITAESKLGKGATFNIYLPVQ